MTPESTRIGNNKEQRERGNSTEPEEYTKPLLLLLEDEEGTRITIQRQIRTRTKSDTENQPKGKYRYKEELKTEKEIREIKVKELREEITEMKKEQDRMKERDKRERRRDNILITGIKHEIMKEKVNLEEWIKGKKGVAVNLKTMWKAKKGELIGAECRQKSKGSNNESQKRKTRRRGKIHLT